jgi:LysM repeat protein
METNNLKEDKVLQGQMIAIKAPSGSSLDLTVKTNSGKTIYHQVKPDETIGTIAGIYGVSEENLVKWNSDKIDGSILKAGSILKIEEPVVKKGSANSTPKNINKPAKYYKVKRGETLSSLSRKFGIPVNDLKSLNKNLDPDNIKAGQKLRIR